MKNPLRKRILREIKKQWMKYIVLFLLMTVTIGFVSGMFVANNSMEKAANDAFEKYNIEDGHFNLKNEATSELINEFEKQDITIYKQYYKEFKEDYKGKDDDKNVRIRVFKMREEINKACLLEGRFPDKDDEIVIDRMHADNNGISVGDMIKIDGYEAEVVGLVSFSDYTCLFENSTEIMFDALTFDVGAVTEEFYDKIEGKQIYQYAYLFDDEPKDEDENKELSDKLIENVAVSCIQNDNEITDFVPEYANKAIHFAPDDFGSDKIMCEVLLIVLVVVLAFIFAITINNTIVNEAAVIGTLRASGYTRGELLIHYISLPVIITLVAAVVGNVMGYTTFKDLVVKMYYNSYSLPKYTTLWNADGFVKTTVYPLLIMILVCTIVIYKKLRIAPLKFLRRDLRTSKRKKAMRLPRWKFLSRFRLRILFQNLADYGVMFIGILFVQIMLVFALGMPATVNNYKDDIKEYMLADYQYILKSNVDSEGNVINTDDESAEKYSVASLETTDGVHVGEEITIYGYMDESRYFEIDEDLDEDNVYISKAYSDKFGIDKGDSITLKEQYDSRKYSFKVKGIYDLPGTLAVFMPNDNFNKVFEKDEESFTGFLSENEIKDIDNKQIMTVVTQDDMLKIARQLDHSMGAYMKYFSVICMIFALLLIYLLTKLIIEKNAGSISMIKVLGYNNKEINSLYIRLTSIVVVIAALATSFLGVLFVGEIWKIYMYQLDGWFEYYMGTQRLIQAVVMIIISYAIVAAMDVVRIKKIPMTDALKNVE